MIKRHRVVFMGTPAFALPTLVLLAKRSDVDLVATCTAPERPKGRGQRLQKSIIHTWSENQAIPVLTPTSWRDNTDLEKQLRLLRPDLIVVVAYGFILPEWLLSLPPMGCVNIHGSLLPKWRGAAPIQRALMAGDKETGITLMFMDRGMDTGDMIAHSQTPIHSYDTSLSLFERLATLGAQTLDQNLEALLNGCTKRLPQNHAQATYAPKIDKEDYRLDWTLSCQDLALRIRALAPKTFFEYKDKRFHVHKAKPLEGAASHVSSKNLIFDCGVGALQIDVLAEAGRAPCSRKDFLNGYSELF